MPISHVENIDCLQAMKGFGDKFFDVLLTDSPYGVGLKYNSYDDSEKNWYDLMERFIPEAKRVSKMVIMPSCRINALGWIYQNFPPDWLICWYKGSPGHSAYIGFNDWEPLLVYGKTDGLQMHDYFAVNNIEKMGNYGHPCPKPIKWATWILKRAVPMGGKVLDTFLGSGTTRIAAYKLGFDFWGYEIDKHYFEAQEKRFKAAIAEPLFEQVKPEQQTFF